MKTRTAIRSDMPGAFMGRGSPSPNERAALVETLILSLDKPDPSLDALCLKEAEDRLAAYCSGELGAVDAEQIFADLGKRV
jgi:hypothetical protein